MSVLSFVRTNIGKCKLNRVIHKKKINFYHQIFAEKMQDCNKDVMAGILVRR
jgi:hypothetical protein